MTTQNTGFLCAPAMHWPRTAVLAGAIALAVAAPAHADARHASAHRPQNQLFVTNCDDAGPGSLRDAVANAASGDMVDLSELTCSTITLSSGQIEIPQDDLYIKYSGEGGTPPAIEANFSSRVFHHTGYGTLKLTGLTITQGSYDNTDIFQLVPAYGGCIYSSGNVYMIGSTVDNCIVKDTRAGDAAGGGIFAAGNVTLLHSVVTGNTATSTLGADGAGVFTHGAIDANYTSISDNLAERYEDYGFGGFGGGIAVVNSGNAPSQITNSTIEGNQAEVGGGLVVSGIATYGASITLANTTIYGNTSTYYAAAAYFRGSVTLANSTIAFNECGSSGPAVELASYTDPVEFNSSILAMNGNSVNKYDYDLGSGGYPITIAGANNLIMFANGAIPPPDTLDANPVLMPLADNGGVTLTLALGISSPAIDHGNDVAGFATDQRGNGYPRVFGAAADIGAFESQSVDDTIFANGFDP
ncbi:MAG: choice-of-anchor Q domain-containing protein [Lysobacterales bacterium]